MSMRAPLIAHVVQHFGMGGLENGVVNLLNHMPADRYRHAVVCLDGYTDFRHRLQRDDVQFFALHKRPGKDLGLYGRLFRLLRELRPDLLHTRNLSTLEGQFVAAAAGVRARVHGEHGRDVFDLQGKNRKYNLLRKLARPLVHQYIAVSKDLANWLENTVGAAPQRITQIYNGVDSLHFHPRQDERTLIGPDGFMSGSELLIGSVGRMAEVKDYPNLVRAFLRLLSDQPESRKRLRLVIVGEGDSRVECLDLLRTAGAEHLAWLPGERSDVAEIMRALDIFVLPSLGEGISNTILEAMASGLPVVATRVGGNPELVEHDRTGKLVPAGDSAALAQALHSYAQDSVQVKTHGQTAREKIDSRFSMEAMLANYLSVYDRALANNHEFASSPARTERTSLTKE
ncbi:group 1 glycosyl transferase [Sulfuricella denitrificans skB26]|uniref:Group 1 glycosyl transferase n=1 Tax=Sulfuricella denitrificans (strain DSM 22764 / NBRC 105220 / skB26) TaxID=1163617 RepID=S6ADV7_SULDS|nr:group 1 glycosyl transferase [Sulfuricella denitrificans skB26]